MEENISSAMSKISHIHSVSADFLRKRLSEKGFPDLVSSHGNILFQLSKEPEIPMLELAKKINRDKSTTTVLVRKLEKLGFVKSRPSKEDSRVKFVFLTAKGKKYNELTGDISSELIDTMYGNFSDKEKVSLCKMLDKIEKNFEG